MPKPLVLAWLVAGLAPSLAVAESLTIAHTGVGCVVAEQFPRLEARIDPPGSVARALVHFRTDAARPWYAVAMKPDGQGGFSGILPKPKKSLKAFQYYIDATDRAFATSRTAEQTAQVVPSRTDCQGKMMAGGLGSAATIVLEVPVGAPLVPPGFGSTGVAAAASGTPAGATAGAASGGGGGIGTGTVAAIVGGAAAVAGVAVAVGGGSGDDGSSSGPSTPPTGGTPPSPGGGTTPSPGAPTSPGSSPAPPGGAVYSIVFSPFPGIDVSACAGRRLTWGSQALAADATGHIDTTLSPNEPNTARVTGTITITTLDARIACASGSPSGSLAATGSGGQSYQGTFSFAGQGGSITVTKQ